MIEHIRKAFETITYPYLDSTSMEHGLNRAVTGEYLCEALEGNWQVFLEGWECAIQYLKNRNNTTLYSDVISTGGLDPRNNYVVTNDNK